MKFKFTNSLKKSLNDRLTKFDIEVGVLEDKKHRDPMELNWAETNRNEVITTYAGGDVRRATRASSGKSIADVSKDNRERLGFNFYTKPFEKRDADINKFATEFFKLAFEKSASSFRRAENLLQAIVRNPILRGEYGTESRFTKASKGFSRPMIDTAQLFKAIKAKITRRGSSV